MSEGAQRPRVGVRELRQNLSVYLRRVEQGEAFDVTEHGRLVARLDPAPAPQLGPLDRLIAEGRARAASRPIDGVAPRIELSAGIAGVSESLRRSREDERS